MEALAFQTFDVVELMEREAGIDRLPCLKVDGGASANDFLMQFQAELLQSEILRPQCIETTALGVACLAGLGVGFYQDLGEIKENWKQERSFVPTIGLHQRQTMLEGWKHAVEQAMLRE